VGKNLLHSEFVGHRNLRSLIVIMKDTHCQLAMQQ
jgi:hypothetical protein